MQMPFSRLPALLFALGCQCAAVQAQGQPAPAAAFEAYARRDFLGAAEALKPYEQADGRAAGVVCQLFVESLIPQDETRAAAACDTAARLGDPHGLVWRGLAGREGRPALGLAVSEAGALGYFARAAELGHVPAYARLCEHYHLRKEYRDALAFCRLAAGRGSPAGLYHYGLMLLDGHGVVQDGVRARQALLLAGQQGFAPAFLKLADLARQGTGGTARDSVKAYAWVLLAASAEPDSKAVAAVRAILAAELKEPELVAAQNRARTWASASARK